MSEQHEHPRYDGAEAAWEAQRPDNEDDGEPYAFIAGWLACADAEVAS